MAQVIQVRSGTAATWTSVNPTLAPAEIGLESDTRKFKFGTGTDVWASLPYAVSASGGGGSGTAVDDLIGNSTTDSPSQRAVNAALIGLASAADLQNISDSLAARGSVISAGGGTFVKPLLATGQPVNAFSTTTLSINPGQGSGVALFTGTQAGAWTLANITSDLVGYVQYVTNCSGSTLVVSSGSTTYSGQSSITKCTLNPGQFLQAIASNLGSSFTWAVLATNGALSA